MMQSNDSLEKIALRLESLLDEIKESGSEFASMKTELGMLHEDVKALSKIVREGDGDTSLITRIALLEQKIDGIIKWQEEHLGTHNRFKEGMKALSKELESIHRDVAAIKGKVGLHEEHIQQARRVEQQSIANELQLAHQRKITDERLKGERAKLFFKLLVAFIIAALTFAAGFVANH